MDKQEAITKVLERLSEEGNRVKKAYALAQQMGDEDAGFYWTQFEQFRSCEAALRRGNYEPAIKLLNQLINIVRNLGNEENLFQGDYPLISLRDALVKLSSSAQ